MIVNNGINMGISDNSCECKFVTSRVSTGIRISSPQALWPAVGVLCDGGGTK